jgi:hypothetical protein
MAQVTECLPSKHEALSLIPRPSSHPQKSLLVRCDTKNISKGKTSEQDIMKIKRNSKNNLQNHKKGTV